MSETNNLYNEISYVIDSKEGSPFPFRKVVKGFGSDNNIEENFLVREASRQRTFVFQKLVNTNTYKKEEAYKILGSCFLSDAARIKKDKSIKDINDKESLKENSDLVKIWKSESSVNFLLAAITKERYE